MSLSIHVMSTDGVQSRYVLARRCSAIATMRNDVDAPSLSELAVVSCHCLVAHSWEGSRKVSTDDQEKYSIYKIHSPVDSNLALLSIALPCSPLLV